MKQDNEFLEWFSDLEKESRKSPEAMGYGIILNIAGNLATEAFRQGVTWEQLAERIGMRKAWVSNFFNCSEKTSMLSIMKVALALELEPEVQFTFKREPDSDLILNKAKHRLENYNLNFENKSFSKSSYSEEIKHNKNLIKILENAISRGLPEYMIIDLFKDITVEMFTKEEKEFYSIKTPEERKIQDAV